MKKLLALLLAAVMLTAVFAGCSPAEEDPGTTDPGTTDPGTTDPGTEDGNTERKKLTIVNVPKRKGSDWFNRMDYGNQLWVEKTGDDVTQQGPNAMDPVAQVQNLEDCIAAGVDVITCVPSSPEAVEPVLKKAMEAGIVVLTHEAENQQNCDYDLEAFDNSAYGAHFMDNLVTLAGDSGEYTLMVAQLTHATHRVWSEAFVEQNKAKYPNWKMATPDFLEGPSAEEGQKKFEEAMNAYPNISAFVGMDSANPPSAAAVVESKNLYDQVTVMGTSMPNQSRKYLESGAIKQISFWDPGMAQMAMCAVADIMINGDGVIETGMDLGVEGYESIIVKETDINTVIYGNAWVDCDKDTVGEYNF